MWTQAGPHRVGLHKHMLQTSTILKAHICKPHFAEERTELQKTNFHNVTQQVSSKDSLVMESVLYQSWHSFHYAQEGINLKILGKVKGETAGVSQPTLTWSLNKIKWARWNYLGAQGGHQLRDLLSTALGSMVLPACSVSSTVNV